MSSGTFGGPGNPGGEPPSGRPQPGTLRFERTVHGDRARLRVIGEVDIATADQLAGAIQRCRRDGASTIVLDLAEMTFLDAAGLRVLVRVRRGLDAAGGTLRLINVRPSVRRVLTLTGLTSYLGVEPGPEDGATPGAPP